LTAVSSRFAEFQQQDCAVLAVSTDTLDTHEQWLTRAPAQGGLGGLNFPLASDESGEVCRAYGVYLARQNVSLRALFIIDPNGVLQYQAVNSLTIGRSVDEILRVLAALQTGGVCPADWRPGQSTIDPTQSLGPGRVVGQYRIEELLGSGGFASVFRAADLTLQRQVAVKVLRHNKAKAADAVLAEARAAAALNHPNIAILYSVDTSQGFPMIVMEYIQGEPLSRVLERGPLTHERARAFSRQAALGMAAAHAQRIVHGDLKPANLMVTPTDQVKIMDFGLARKINPAATGETVDLEADGGKLSGTPSYMSPEQTRGERLTPASDVFSLGQIIFELVTGKRAVTGEGLFEVLEGVQQLHGDALAAQTPPPFDAVLRRALVQKPKLRTLRMEEIAALFE
jgi:eukaryotic-like serine/threonine-protein kinase